MFQANVHHLLLAELPAFLTWGPGWTRWRPQVLLLRCWAAGLQHLLHACHHSPPGFFHPCLTPPTAKQTEVPTGKIRPKRTRAQDGLKKQDEIPKVHLRPVLCIIPSSFHQKFQRGSQLRCGILCPRDGGGEKLAPCAMPQPCRLSAAHLLPAHSQASHTEFSASPCPCSLPEPRPSLHLKAKQL